jgi:hypothetical protein
MTDHDLEQMYKTHSVDSHHSALKTIWQDGFEAGFREALISKPDVKPRLTLKQFMKKLKAKKV